MLLNRIELFRELCMLKEITNNIYAGGTSRPFVNQLSRHIIFVIVGLDLHRLPFARQPFIDVNGTTICYYCQF